MERKGAEEMIELFSFVDEYKDDIVLFYDPHLQSYFIVTYTDSEVSESVIMSREQATKLAEAIKSNEASEG